MHGWHAWERNINIYNIHISEHLVKWLYDNMHVSVFVCIEGVFHVQHKGDPAVRLSPCSGVIAAGATQWLKVELLTDRPRRIDEKAL